MFQEDLHIFVDEFGENISFTLSDNTILNTYDDEKPLKGIFDNTFLNAELGNVMMPMPNPTLTCVTADITAVKLGDIVTVENINYSISYEPQPDGTGMTLLELDKC